MYDHTLAIYRIVVMKTRRRFFLLLKEFRKSTLRIYHIPLLNLIFFFEYWKQKEKKITLIIHKHQSFHPLKNTRKESTLKVFCPQPARGSKPKYFPMQRDITHRTRANSIVNVNLITCRHI